ncbi:hypothetical protein [Flavobacterium sp. 3HN19-14]|uniref:hypothetical protein n=1 Tax=Flavobacterium sp. 3HN19-14 TaxID=3448133 RepID=UPI003EE12BAC
METTLYKIQLDDYHHYDIENYIKKRDIYISCIGPNTISKNNWPEIRQQFFTKVLIVTENKQKLYVPLKKLFGNIPDWQLFELLAVIDQAKPKIFYEFYKIGENYGNSKQSIVRNKSNSLHYFRRKNSVEINGSRKA